LLHLAIDTSARQFSIALFNRGVVIASFHSRSLGKPSTERRPTDRGQRGLEPVPKPFPPGASVTLFPALQQLFENVQRKPNELQLVSVAIGPGMFTGLRVGVVLAKTLAYTNQIPVIGVNTLEVLAAQIFSETKNHDAPVCTVINAQRQQLFAGQFQHIAPWHVNAVVPTHVTERTAWLDQLPAGAIVGGAGLLPFEKELSPSLLRERRIELAPRSCWACTAEGVGQVAWRYFEEGRRDDFWTLAPLYFRPSSAEEVRQRLGSSEKRS